MNRQELESLDKPALIDLLERVLSRIEALEAENAQLKERLAKLERPPKTPDNSSLPPSKGQKANRPERKRKGRKGRPGTARVLAENPDEIVDCKATSCPDCDHTLPPEDQKLTHEYDHVDIPPVTAHTTRVRIFACRCPGCGRKARGVPPHGMEPGTPFGPRLHALAAYLHHHHAIAYGRLSLLFKEIWNLSISEGAIANALKRTGQACSASREEILKLLRRAQIICSDETGARVEGKSEWEWVFVSPDAVLHEMAHTRGAVVPKDVLDGHRPQVWVSDRFTAQAGHGRDAQVCLAHVLRDVQYAIDEGDRRAGSGHGQRARKALRLRQAGPCSVLQDALRFRPLRFRQELLQGQACHRSDCREAAGVDLPGTLDHSDHISGGPSSRDSQSRAGRDAFRRLDELRRNTRLRHSRISLRGVTGRPVRRRNVLEHFFQQEIWFRNTGETCP